MFVIWQTTVIDKEQLNTMGLEVGFSRSLGIMEHKVTPSSIISAFVSTIMLLNVALYSRVSSCVGLLGRFLIS